MRSPAEIEHRIKVADPVPTGSDLPLGTASAADLLERIDSAVGGGAVATRPSPLVKQSRRRRRLAPVVAVAAFAAVLIPVAITAVALRGGGSGVASVHTDATELPFYARFLDGDIIHDDHWAVIVFYRPPACVPPLANLLAEEASSVAKECGPPTVAGTAGWENGPRIDPAPLELSLTGRGAVPVWLVPWDLLDRLAGDGVVTRRDLLSVQSRIEATAGEFSESSRGALVEMTGSGVLSDGGEFGFSVTGEGPSRAVVVDVPVGVDLVDADRLAGVWENSIGRVQFGNTGSLAIAITRSAGFGTVQAPDVEESPLGVPASYFSEGTFDVESGFITVRESGQSICPNSGTEGTYFGRFDTLGRLVVDVVDDPCVGRVDVLTRLLTRVN